YAPYLRFPVTDARQSGWLFPNMGYSQEDGVDLAVPYYFNLAPNYDLILTPRLISERGLGLEAGGRYLNGYGDFGLYGAALPGDDLYNGELERDDFFELNPDGEFEAADRWLYGMTHAGQRELGRGVLRTFVDYTAVSDGDYFRDLGTDLGVSSRIQLERLGEVIYSQGEFEARLWAQRFQVLDGALQKPYERLPELSLRHGGQLPAGLRWAMGAAWASFDRDTRGLSGINAVTGSRLHLTPRLTLPLSWPFGFLTVSAGYNLTRYDLDVDEAGLDSSFDTRPSRDIPFGSVDGSLIFERPLRLFGNAFVQTLEPRLYYLNQDFVDQSDLPNFDSGPLTFQYRQLFRENRFAGIDRIGDANQVSVGITSRLLDAASGREQLRASLGQIRYFEDRRVTLIGAPTEADRQAGSVYVAELSGTLARNFRWQGVGVWDGYTNDVIESSIQIGYQSGPQRILNLGYRTRDEAGVDQSDVSVYWPLTRRFSVLGRWNYDLESGRTIEGLGGIEYNDCCWKIRLLARRFIDSPSVQAINTIEADEGIDLQIVFKGLAGFGNATETVLERSIRGYQPQQ
ncbi:MAG: LPS assembly protein LptD, partial [Pseudomonadota bacterium]